MVDILDIRSQRTLQLRIWNSYNLFFISRLWKNVYFQQLERYIQRKFALRVNIFWSVSSVNKDNIFCKVN